MTPDVDITFDLDTNFKFISFCPSHLFILI